MEYMLYKEKLVMLISITDNSVQVFVASEPHSGFAYDIIYNSKARFQ